MRTFFTADTHFFHQNIIKYCSRPFDHADEMNEVIIRNWNNVVTPQDEIYHLGDFAFCPPDKAANIARRLNGKKYLIRGNHDKTKTVQALEPFFEWVKDTYLATVQDKQSQYGNQQVWLSHYCHLVWPQQHYGVWHLFGHSHGMCEVPFTAKSLDVGVDSHMFYPVSYEQIKIYMSQRGGRKGI